MPLTAPSRIIYAQPLIDPPQQVSIALLTMPAVTSVEPLQTVLHTLMPFGTYDNTFTPLNCTAGVASRLPVTWSGNANEWADNAQLQGIEISNVPRVGAIAQTTGDSYLGHVGIITAINDDGTFTVWEENYYGLGVTDERVTSTAEFPTFIYF